MVSILPGFEYDIFVSHRQSGQLAKSSAPNPYER